MELAGVGDILVDEDQGGAVVCQQLAEGVAGVGGVLVVGAHALEGGARLARAAGGMAELPGKLAPQRAHLGAVGLGDWVAGRDAVADEDDAVDAWEFVHFRRLHDVIDAVQLAGLRAGKEVVEGEHGVRLAAAEVGLQLDDGLAALAIQAQQSICQQASQTLGQVGAAEELGRVAVFGGTLAEMDLPEVGGEFGLLVVAAGDVGVGVDYVAPGGQAAGGCCGDDSGGTAALAAGLFVKAQAQQFHLQLFDLVRFG